MQDSITLESPIYTSQPKLGWGGYTIKVNAFNVLTAQDGKRLLKKFASNLTKDDHLRIGTQHFRLAHATRKQISSIVETEFLRVFGRPYSFGDYKVSGIVRDEFSNDVKDQLRELNKTEGRHHRVGIFHIMAGGLTHAAALKKFELMKND